MAQEPTEDQIMFATRAWMIAMRRLWVRRHGTARGDCPVKPLDDYSPEDRRVMSLAIKAALIAGDPNNVEAAIKRLEA
ncbi:hypothetical protein FV222_00245 [Methylobacterium sp. WL103]|uniref:hypothetical protein n=1 Tax=Methylobacterium sp. WL103 TaxID=2603891 RepID=UPI0011D64CA9|nr:hypothetical protein [Methylobacterium sp. WL103]TXN08935.1 hypothetical protein FV222_00245 [Methylobacterium sp. WL103]